MYTLVYTRTIVHTCSNVHIVTLTHVHTRRQVHTTRTDTHPRTHTPRQGRLSSQDSVPATRGMGGTRGGVCTSLGPYSSWDGKRGSFLESTTRVTSVFDPSMSERSRGLLGRRAPVLFLCGTSSSPCAKGPLSQT